MQAFLNGIRAPERDISLKKQIIITAVISLLGLVLGVLQKWLDQPTADNLPWLIERLDISNYFGRLAIWILLATVISVYSETPLRASVNTFSFLISMLLGYYAYCNYVLGFLPVSYMMIWVCAASASFFMAYICWYAKGKGIAAIVISSLITGVLLAQAVSLTQGFYVYHFTELITWAAGMVILYRKPKEYALEIGLSIIVAFGYQLVMPEFG